MLAAAIAAGPACSTSSAPADVGPSVDAVMDAGAVDAGAVDAGAVDAGPADRLPPDGIPPMDAGTDADPPPAPLYGAPPATDAG